MEQDDTFVTNLRFACATRRSISQICREIGINRQQFNRYINGEARPSPHNVARIVAFFGVSTQDFSLSPKLFEARMTRPERHRLEAGQLLEGFPGDAAALRRHLGYYQTYHLSLSWPGFIVCSCAHIYEEGGSIRVKSIERIRDVANEIQQFSKYVGLVTFWRNRIFIAERTVGHASMLAQTILMPFEVHQRVYLRGTTMGVSWRKENLPYASRMIWRHIGQDPDKRQMLSRCGLLPFGSRQLPSAVRRFLETPDAEVLTIPAEY
ncbi:helix-turn-helix domain-containing protein [Sinorhizobium mexicanum]|uniref:Helix-turn-helix transcriptional regulator n=1 Tax=Sinorhizobium mexicanum TaxID=375549 RepID=A0A859QV43_9HYPH|nr:helix-turn-helix transcriptional regulator [Sinorhizobium mexicanum]MBP1883392.1 transcriptional regulator with XRE-family HTH domain [Sinorhizobium mexicanum]QLL62591.1 helix-turn-helix transcriptional regulator [Sinorhizobium mexicanum]